MRGSHSSTVRGLDFLSSLLLPYAHSVPSKEERHGVKEIDTLPRKYHGWSLSATPAPVLSMF